MTTPELKKITSYFSDIKPLIIKRNDLLRQTNKVRRRLKTKVKEYLFLLDLVGIDSSGDALVNAVVDFFKALGFDKVENVDKKYKDEDIRLWVNDILLIIEVTGIDTANPKYTKAHQISMHIPSRQAKYPNFKVFGAFVVNHDNKKYFTKRDKKPFTKDINEIAQSHKYTLTTTVDLFNAFIQFKKGTLTSTDIIDKLCSTGELKILGA